MEKLYWAKNLGNTIQFITPKYSDNIYLLSDKTFSIIYKVNIENKSVKEILKTDFSLKNGKLPIVYLQDRTMIIPFGIGLYLYQIVENIKH